MTGRRVEGDEVYYSKRDFGADVGGEGCADRDLERVRDLEVPSTKDRKGFGLKSTTMGCKFRSPGKPSR